MGATVKFTCNQCAYAVTVDVGDGFTNSALTYECTKCKVIYNCHYYHTKENEAGVTPCACTLCGTAEHAVNWEHGPSHCPKCRTTMTMTSEGLWD